MDSGQSFVSSFGAVNYYPNISNEAEVIHRPKHHSVGLNQSSFFSLLTKLNVPIMGRGRNRDIQDTVLIGQGTSYVVTQGIVILSSGAQGFLNRRPLSNNRLEGMLEAKTFVTKRIVSSPSQATDDSRQLAAITNEIRILAIDSLKKAPCIVQMLGVGWDEVATAGRYWPRLLIEAADYGTLGDFLTTSNDATNMVVRIELLYDVLEGLKALHMEGIAHCDLKLENVLVFHKHNRDVEDSSEFPHKYQVKLCDFGFAVVQHDWNIDSSFCGRLGTEPWNAPELMGISDVKISDLPKADIYSFGLLASRVLAQGQNPFKDSNPDDLLEMKQRADDCKELTTFDTVALWLVSLNILVDEEKSIVVAILLSTLAHKPDDRQPISKFAYLLIHLEVLVRKRIRATSSLFQSETPHTTEDSQDKNTVPETFYERIYRHLQIVTRVVLWPTSWAFRQIRSMFSRITRYITGAVMSVSDSYKLVTKRHGLLEELPELVNIPSSTETWSNLPDIVEFELPLEFNRLELPDPIATELYRDLVEKSQDESSDAQINAAEACYQIAVAHFEGIGIIKNKQKTYEWLDKAVDLGSEKALSAAFNVFLSFDTPLPEHVISMVGSKLRDHAENELHGSLLDSVQNKQHTSMKYPSTLLWSTQSPNAYLKYLESSFLDEMKTIILSAVLVFENYKPFYTPFDFSLLKPDGFDPSGDPHFDISKKTRFIDAVRLHKCIESIGTSRLTLLQLAATMGDIQMAEILILDLHAEVNASGGTPHYSPLWISCLNGHIDVCLFLIKHGADVLVKDATEGRSILHFLNRFRSKTDINRILQICLQAGVDVDNTDFRGNTPLLSTFIGWDFSHGIAARCLLDAHADPFVKSNAGFSVVFGALKTFDADFLAVFFKQAGVCDQNESWDDDTMVSRVDQEKANCFNFLCDRSDFYCRRICGKSIRSRLKDILSLSLHESSSATFSLMGLAEGHTTPLIISAYMKQNVILKLILDSPQSPPLNEVDINGLTAIHWCAARGNIGGARLLLKAGANPLIFDNKGLNIFHVAAKFAPEFLVQIIDFIEVYEIPHLKGRTGHELLNIRTKDQEATPFVFAVMEGTPGHLKCAETLRTRYHLDYDDYGVPALRIFHDDNGRSKMTLMAYLTASSVIINIMTLGQAEYLLGLDPMPRFRADTSGRTLLQFAVSGLHHANMGSNTSGYAVLQLLLRKFPAQSYIEQRDDDGNTCIHTAAAASHVTALQIIQSHLSDRNEHLDVNILNNKGETPLDLLGKMAPSVHNLKNEYVSKIFRERTDATWKFLIELGGYGSGEPENEEVGEIVQNNPDSAELAGVFERVDEAWMNARLEEYGMDLRGLLDMDINHVLLTKDSEEDIYDA